MVVYSTCILVRSSFDYHSFKLEFVMSGEGFGLGSLVDPLILMSATYQAWKGTLVWQDKSRTTTYVMEDSYGQRFN